MTIDPMPRKDLQIPPPIGYISLSEHAALIRAAEARVWEAAAAKLEPAPNAKNGLWANRVRKLQAMLRAEAAALKGKTT